MAGSEARRGERTMTILSWSKVTGVSSWSDTGWDMARREKEKEEKATREREE